jgi:hypothetical protein
MATRRMRATSRHKQSSKRRERLYGDNLEAKLTDLHERIHKGSYGRQGQLRFKGSKRALQEARSQSQALRALAHRAQANTNLN